MASTATSEHPPSPNFPNSIVINGDVVINYFIDSHSPPLASINNIRNISNLNINGTCNINYNLNTVAETTETADKDHIQVSKLSKPIKLILSFLLALFTLFAGGYQLVLNTVAETTDKDQVQVSKLSKWIKPLFSFVVFLFTLFAGGCQLVLKKEWKFSL